MDILLIFFIFIVCMAASLLLDLSMLVPLLIGLLLFSAAALRRGFTCRALLGMIGGSLHDSFLVIGILLLVGCLTGLWRASGTIASFVTIGVKAMPKSLFLLAAFLLGALMSFAFGTSFGVTATAGVILMTIARAGGVPPVPAAGAILSGVYVGDRGSPAASSANLVAVLTHTDITRNIRLMLKSSLLPFLLCCLVYGVLAVFFPMKSVDAKALGQLEEEFTLGYVCLIPAALMILLPLLKVNIKLSMLVSIIASVILAMSAQSLRFLDCLKVMLFGFTPKNKALTEMLSGGGIVSMAEVCGILFLSGSYGGIFRKTGMLSPLTEKLKQLSVKVGRYGTMLLLSVGVCAVFCNQTIGAIMQSQLSAALYGDDEEEKYAKMMDMEDTVILIAGLVPWCIASSVPLTMLDADLRSLPFAFYLWLVPLCSGLKKSLSRKLR